MNLTAIIVVVSVLVVFVVLFAFLNRNDQEVVGKKDEYGEYVKDPLRMFVPYVIFEAKRRADHRCEYVDRFGFRCSNSEENGVTLHADHWIPWSKGGASSEHNIVILCSHCNLAKSNVMPFKWETKKLWKSRRGYQVNAMIPGEYYLGGRLDLRHSSMDRMRVAEGFDASDDGSRPEVIGSEVVDADQFYGDYVDGVIDDEGDSIEGSPRR